MAIRSLASDMAAARRELLARLLFDAFSVVRDDLFEGLARLGHQGITMQHSMVLRQLDAEGSKMSDITRRSGASRQAVARVVVDLVERGYLSVEADQADRRNQLVSLTPRGEAFVRDIIEAARGTEAKIARRLGRQPTEELRVLLRDLSGGGPLPEAAGPVPRPKAVRRSTAPRAR